MNIGIIVHSKTGVTSLIAGLIADKLTALGHSPEITLLKTDVPVESDKTLFNILNLPDCEKYDFVLVGGPVWAFSPTPVVIAAICSMKGIHGKKALPFISMGLPFNVLGGNRTVGIMESELKKHGANALPGVVFHRKDRFNKVKMDETISSLIQALGVK